MALASFYTYSRVIPILGFCKPAVPTLCARTFTLFPLLFRFLWSKAAEITISWTVAVAWWPAIGTGGGCVYPPGLGK